MKLEGVNLIFSLNETEVKLLKREPGITDEQWDDNMGRFEDEVVTPQVQAQVDIYKLGFTWSLPPEITYHLDDEDGEWIQVEFGNTWEDAR